MKLMVTNRYCDKYTHEIVPKGTTVEATAERAKELLGAGVAEKEVKKAMEKKEGAE